MVIGFLFILLVIWALASTMPNLFGSPYVGVWKGRFMYNEMTLTLERDGTGTLRDVFTVQELTWRAEDDHVAFSFDGKPGGTGTLAEKNRVLQIEQGWASIVMEKQK